MKPVTVIIGAGPAASTMAALLAQRGETAVVFDDGQRPELIVGESLIPAVVPLLRQLGIEDRVAAISQHKPGVSFLHELLPSIDFNFTPAAPYLPTYAYNVERHSFDALLRQRALELGAIFLPQRGHVRATAPGSAVEIELDPVSVAACPQLEGRQPAMLIDATGRTRLFSKLLSLSATSGPRDDLAYFAHYENFALPRPSGQVLISRLQKGWNWRIPLPQEKLSVGLVINKELAKTLGDTPEERLENSLAREPLLSSASANARRISPVAVYRNYQRIGCRASGPGWAAIGDAFGFVDPMLSSGLFLAMESASQLDQALTSNSKNRFANYETTMREWFRAWDNIVEYFYDGRLFSLYEAGFRMKLRRSNRIQMSLDRLLNKHIACMTAGALTRAFRSRALLKIATKTLLHGVRPPAQLAIR